MGSPPVREELKSLMISYNFNHVCSDFLILGPPETPLPHLFVKGSRAGEPRASWQGWVQTFSLLVLKLALATRQTFLCHGSHCSHLLRKERDKRLNFFLCKMVPSIALRLQMS